MLSYLRRNTGSWVIKAVLIGIALSFVIGFGVLPSLRDPAGEDNVVAKVGDRVITRGQWNQAHENMLRFYRDMYKDQLSDEMIQQMQLREAALDNLINQALQQQEARRWRLDVTDEELQERIRSLPYFQRDGRFSRELYINLLRRNRMSPAQFEEMQREEALIEKMQELVLGNVKVSDRELRHRYALDGEQVTLRVLALDPRDFEASVTADPEALKTYFQENTARFLTPEKVRIEYVKIPWEPFAERVRVFTGDVEDYYDLNIESYSQPETIRLRQIFLRVPPGEDASVFREQREVLEGLRERIEQGADFAELARSTSQDASASAGGDLGYVRRGDLAPEVERAAAFLEPGQVSDVVRSPQGLHLLKLEDRRAASRDPLEEVEEEIRAILRQEGAWREARRRAEEVVWSARESGGFGALSFEDGVSLSVERTGFFARGDFVPNLGREPGVQNAAFQAQVGALSDAVRAEDGYVVFRLLERKAPELPPYEDVQDRVEKHYRREGSWDLARERAEQVLAELRAGASVDTLGEDPVVSSFDTSPFSRLSGYVPRIGASPELVDSVFSLTEADPVAPVVFEVSDRFFLVRVAQWHEPDWDAFERDREAYERMQLERKRQEVYRQWLSGLRETWGLKITPRA